MSFSSDVKEELLQKSSNISKKNNECCVISEKFGELLTQVSFKNELKDEFMYLFDISKLKECCIRAILRGCFLSSGFVNDPGIDYHVEILFKNKSCAEYILDLLSVLDFSPKLIKRKASYVIYFKEGEQVSYFLQLIGANKSYLYFEQIRVEKNVKNNINRAINCEVANIAKTIKSSKAQIDAINKLKKALKFEDLSEKLKYAASLRLKYPTESLDFLSNISKEEEKYISKSGLKHRFDKIIQEANKI